MVPENVDGKVEDRGKFKEYGNAIYMKVYNLIARGECNIRNVSKEYYDKNGDIGFCALIIVLSNLFRDIRDYVDEYILS